MDIQLAILDGSSDILNPTIIKRYNLFSVRSQIQFNSTSNYTASYQWKFYKIDQNMTNQTEDYLKSNPTIYAPTLVIKGNALEYGIYRFYLSSKVVLGKNAYNYQSEKFFLVIPSGISVFGLENGNTQAYIGKNQSFELNPPKYSFDLDMFTPMSSLKFKFYCYITPTGTQTDQTFLSQVLSNLVDDLNTIKTKQASPANFCFNSTGIISFKFYFILL